MDLNGRELEEFMDYHEIILVGLDDVAEVAILFGMLFQDDTVVEHVEPQYRTRV